MGKVLVKKDEPHQCFARLELNNGDQVMISIAHGEVKVVKMKWAGMLPGPTLWKSENVGEIAEKFFDETTLPQRPIEAVIDKIIDCRSAEEVVARLSAEPDLAFSASDGRGAGCGLPDGERASHSGGETRRRRPL
jgi:hypothetical protein